MTTSSQPTVMGAPATQASSMLPAFVLVLAGLVWLPACLRFSVEWSVNAQYFYGWAVPFLAAYLAFERVTNCPPARSPAHPVIAILLIVLFALPQPLLRIVSEANSDWRLVDWLLAASAGGISFALLYFAGSWPWVWRFGFPILFLATAIPWPTSMENLLVQGMMRLNASISAEFVSFCGVPAIAEGNVIRLPTGTLGVNEACSGIRSLQSTLMASIFLGGLYQLPIFARVCLALVGIGIAFVLNIVRTVFLSWQGAFHGIEATEKWHDSAGFAILGVVLVCLWLISRYLESRYAPPVNANGTSEPPKAPASA